MSDQPHQLPPAYNRARAEQVFQAGMNEIIAAAKSAPLKGSPDVWRAMNVCVSEGASVTVAPYVHTAASEAAVRRLTVALTMVTTSLRPGL